MSSFLNKFDFNQGLVLAYYKEDKYIDTEISKPLYVFVISILIGRQQIRLGILDNKYNNSLK